MPGSAGCYDSRNYLTHAEQEGWLPVKTRDIVRAWRKILAGKIPSLSIEVTRECPLSCPGCYAYGDDHLGGALVLKQVRDYRGQELVDGILKLVDEYKPLHVSLVGGEPLVRYKEITAVLPLLEARGIHTQVVTSAVRPIPEEWRDIRKMSVVVSIDGLQPEHDARRKPATYERILKHIAGHTIIVHCTLTRHMTKRPGYLREFFDFWSSKEEVRKIWVSIYTPQKGETSYEILPPGIRRAVIDELSVLREEFEKVELPIGVLKMYLKPPRDPGQCCFARTTRSVTADLKKQVTPCQFGGDPDCSQCGCFASAALGAVAAHRLPVGIRAGAIYDVSYAIGQWVNSMRHNGHKPSP
jgi:MoaA/NifB/PqqE/SkfB family radical SAM enzyme